MNWIVLMFALSFSVPSVEMSQIRKKYFSAAVDQSEASSLLALTQQATHSSPIRWAYKGVAYTLMAKNAATPFKKLSYFNKGKKILDEAVKHLPKDIEPRFLRLTVQVNAPSFLNYNSHIKEDKSFILRGLKQAKKLKNDNFFIHKVVKFLKTSDVCTLAELNQLQALQ